MTRRSVIQSKPCGCKDSSHQLHRGGACERTISIVDERAFGSCWPCFSEKRSEARRAVQRKPPVVEPIRETLSGSQAWCVFCGEVARRVLHYYWRCPACSGVFGEMSVGQSVGLVRPTFCNCADVSERDLFAYEIRQHQMLSANLASVSSSLRRGQAHKECRGIVRVSGEVAV